ncbi:MAG TPA: type I secretion system permease/ATPase [Devosiaceae bacterium]|nr:type I secretion system permease/ATPase [Devosiaceae bacterium]
MDEQEVRAPDRETVGGVRNISRYDRFIAKWRRRPAGRRANTTLGNTISIDTWAEHVGSGEVGRQAPAGAADPLLAALQYLARTWGRPVSSDVLLAGLPLQDGRVSMQLLPRALERVGLACVQAKRRLDDLADFDMPALLQDDYGTLVIAVARLPSGDLRGFDPQTGMDVIVSPERARPKRRRSLVLVKPAFDSVGLDGARDTEARIQPRHWLRAALSGHGTSIANVILAAVFVNLFAIAMPLFTMNVYDRVLPNKAMATLWVLAIGLVMVQIFDLLLKLARGAVIDYVGRKIDFRMSSALFDRVMNADLATRPGSTGAFVNKISQYEVLRDFFTSSTVVMFVDILFMGLFVFVIGSLIGWVVLFPLAASITAILATLAIGIRSGAAIRAALAESGSRNAILIESLSAVQTVKANRAEGQFLRRWENSVLASSETHNKIKWYQAVASQITAVLGQLAMVSIIIGGSYSFADSKITTGAIIAAMMLSNRLIGPIAQISSALLRTRGAIEAYRVLDSIMNLPDERTVHKGFVTRSIKSGKIEFNKVRFAYPGAKQFVLDQVSFTINPGEKVGVIGRVGSGKTTVGRLLVHFFEPSEGEVLVDGVSLGQYHPAELRRQVGFLLQDPELFNGTVKENIVFADPTASDDKIVDIARRAGVEQFVSRHPLGYDMPVGERGNLLSGGQRQAIALARTLLVDPKILFLDEPSSSMDLATERQLIEHLHQSLAPDSTVLIATHRFSLLSLVTRLIVIDNGHIVADGPRDAVLNKLKASGGEG